MNKQNKTHNNKGFSIQSVIIGSIISGILMSAGVSAFYPLYEKKLASEEKKIIDEKELAYKTALQINGQPFFTLDGSYATLIKENSNISNRLNYSLAWVHDSGAADGNITNDNLVLIATASTNQQINLLSSISTKLKSNYLSDFVYQDTCIAADQSDCYYIKKIAGKGNIELMTNILISEDLTGLVGQNAITAATGIAKVNL